MLLSCEITKLTLISKIGAEVHSENSFLQYEKTAPAEVRKRQVGVTLSLFVCFIDIAVLVCFFVLF